MPRFTEHRIACNLANISYSDFSIKFAPSKHVSAFDTNKLKSPYHGETALCTGRMANPDPFFVCFVLVDVCHYFPCGGIQVRASSTPSPVQSIPPAPPVLTPPPAQTDASPAPPTPSQTVSPPIRVAVASVPTVAEKKAHRKAKTRNRRKRGIGLHISAMRC